MLRYLFLCLLLVCVSLGQSNRSSSPPPELKPRLSSPNAETQGTSSSTVAPDAPVITVQGLCEKPAGLSSNPADCKTLVTKAEFEKLTGPNMAPAQRKALADQYVKDRKSTRLN